MHVRSICCQCPTVTFLLVVAVLVCGPARSEEAAPAQPVPVETKTESADEVGSVSAADPVSKDADGLGWDAARWRIELTTTTAYHSGRRSRSGDYALRSNVDYEIPVLKHMTVAPRIIPLMYYNENGKGDSTFWAFGIGVVLRGYSNGEEQRGWFGEGGLHLIGQTGKFEGNTGSFNFVEEIGFGYMFRNGVSAAVKVNHTSNAGFAEDNAGCNTVGLGIGYSFKR